MMNKLNNPFIILVLVIGGFFFGGTLNTSTFIKDLTSKVLSAQTTPTPTTYIEEIYVEPTEEPIPTEVPVFKKQVINNYPTNYPNITQVQQTVPISNNTAKLQSIGVLFKKIEELNTQIKSAQMLGSGAAEGMYVRCEDYQYGEFLPNGEKNPKYIFNPFDRDRLYQQCVNNNQEPLNATNAQIESLINQIRDLNKQILAITTSCSGNECINYYRDSVTTFEANGFIVR